MSNRTKQKALKETSQLLREDATHVPSESGDGSWWGGEISKQMNRPPPLPRGSRIPPVGILTQDYLYLSHSLGRFLRAVLTVLRLESSVPSE